MKKLLYILLLLFPVMAMSQNYKNIGNTNETARAKGGLEADSLIIVPVRDTNYIPFRPGALDFRGSQLYLYNGVRWMRVSTDTIGAAVQVNSDWNASSGVSQILNKPLLATVATTGSYNDLLNKPTIPAAQVNSDWNAVSGVSQILNKPSQVGVIDSIYVTSTDLSVVGSPLLKRNDTLVLNINNNAVTYGKIQQVTASRLLGNPTGINGNVSEIPLGSGLAFSAGSLIVSNVPNSSLQNSSFTIASTDLSGVGSVSLGGTATLNINAGAVTYGKIQNIPTQTLLGRYNIGTGQVQSVTVGAGLNLDPITGILSGTGGSGNLDTVKAGALSPLFGTTVVSSANTAQILFSFINAAPNSVFGNPNGTATAPSYFTPSLTSSLFANEGSNLSYLQGNASGNLTFSAVNLNGGVSGILPIANGGTSASTRNNAINNLLPPQTGDSTFYLATDGTNAFWKSSRKTVYARNGINPLNDSTLEWGGTLIHNTSISASNAYSLTLDSLSAGLYMTFLSSRTPIITDSALIITTANRIYKAPLGGGGAGTVTNVNTGLGLLGGPITTVGSISIDTSVVARLSDLIPSWHLTGNAGTTAGTNFIGTTDNVDLIFERNSVVSGRLNNASAITTFGVGSLPTTSTGFSNTAFGKSTLAALTTGSQNTAVGSSALTNDTSGNANTAIGDSSQLNNTLGTSNTSIGLLSLYNNVGGINNTALGTYAMQGVANKSPYSDIAVGYKSLFGITTGYINVAIGDSALYALTSANSDIAIGYQSQLATTTGNSNVSIGTQSLKSNTTGANNIAIGISALFNNVVGTHNIAIGSNSLANNTDTANTAVGSNTLNQNTIGYGNSAFGAFSLNHNTLGSRNSAFGDTSLFTNLIGNDNTAFGNYALYLTTGSSNSAFGSSALHNQSTGFNNIGIGLNVGYEITTGANNVAIGVNTLRTVTGASNNVIIGDSALNSVGFNTASNSVAIGFKSLGTASTTLNNTAIGYLTMGNSAGGAYSIAIGDSTLYNAGSLYNIAIGSVAMKGVSAGISGSYNAALGYNVLYNLSTGSKNAGIGRQALYNLTTGSNNVAIGDLAGYSMVDASGSISIGQNAMHDNKHAINSVGIGAAAMYNDTSGTGNVGIGYQAYSADKSGSYNVAVGYNALTSLNGGSFGNVGVGQGALGHTLAAGTTNYGVAIGYAAAQQYGQGDSIIVIGGYTSFSGVVGVNSILIGAGTNTGLATGANTTILGHHINTTMANVVILSRFDQHVIIGSALSGEADSSTTLQIRGAITLNKDSLPSVSARSSQYILAYDTTTKKVNKYIGSKSGTYVPAITGISNVASSTSHRSFYTRTDSLVEVTAYIDVTPTTGGSSVTVDISLPISSTFSAAEDCYGVGTSSNGGLTSAVVSPDLGDTHKAGITYVPTGGGSGVVKVVFTYYLK
jgi:hypothetical protein